MNVCRRAHDGHDPRRSELWNSRSNCVLHRSTGDVGAEDRVEAAVVIVNGRKEEQMPLRAARKVPNPRCGHEVVPEGLADAPTRGQGFTEASETGSEI